jgi:hypothetical protein
MSSKTSRKEDKGKGKGDDDDEPRRKEYIDDLLYDRDYRKLFSGKYQILGSSEAWGAVETYLRTSASRSKSIHACLQFFYHPRNYMVGGALAGKTADNTSVDSAILDVLPRLEGEEIGTVKSDTKRHVSIRHINFTVVQRVSLMALQRYGKDSKTTMGWVIKFGGTPCQVTRDGIARAMGNKQGPPRGDKYPGDKYGATVEILYEYCERFCLEKPYWEGLAWDALFPRVKKS